MKKYEKLTLAGILILFVLSPSMVFAQSSSGLNLPHSLGDIAVDPFTNTIYVATAGAGQGFEGVFVFDGQTHEMIDQIDLEGKNIRSLAINPNTNFLYVGYSNVIDVIDLGTKSIVATIKTLEGPIKIAINTDTNVIFVSNSWINTLTVIDGNSNSIVKNISMRIFPDAISINQDTNTVYVAINSGGRTPSDDRIYVIDGKSLETQKILQVGNRHEGIGVNPITNMVYVSNFGSFTETNNTVSVIDGKTYQEVDEIKVGDQPTHISIDPKNNLIYVQNFGSNSISVIDGNSNQVISEIEIGKFHHDGLAVNTNSGLVYVAQGINVHVIDGKTNEVSVIETKENELSLFDIVYMIWYFYYTEILLFFAILGIIIFSVYKIKKRKSVKI